LNSWAEQVLKFNHLNSLAYSLLKQDHGSN
jgi:hypothetical protein